MRKHTGTLRHLAGVLGIRVHYMNAWANCKTTIADKEVGRGLKFSVASSVERLSTSSL
jgi:hypothetical protein